MTQPGIPLGHTIPAHRAFGWCSHCPDHTVAEELAAWQTREPIDVSPGPAAEIDRLRTANERMRHELEVMYGGAFDKLPEPAAVSAAVAPPTNRAAPFGSPDCTCVPFTRKEGMPRACGPDDTVDDISGWETGRDCPHHAPVASPTDPTHGLSVPHADALWDAVAIPGPRTPTYPEQHERVCRAVRDILDELTPARDETVARAALRDRIADKLTAAAYECDGKCGLSERECYDAHPITFSAMAGGTTHVDGSVTAIAEAALTAVEAALCDTVANRAAQVITTMGAEIRELTHSRDRYRTAWLSARHRIALRRMADETATETPADTLSAWLYQRFMPDGIGWDQLDEEDRSYWEHQARAVRRAVARGGFKQPAAGARQDGAET